MRFFEDIAIGQRREVEDLVRTDEQLHHQAAIGNVGLDEAKSRIAIMLGEVAAPPDRKIVDRQHRTPGGQQRIH